MNLIATSDWHITANPPRIRKDDYPYTAFKKFLWILEQAKSRGAGIAVAGDLFDVPRCPLWLLKLYIEEMIDFSRFHGDIFTIPGQHDMHNHVNDMEDTPLGVLLASEACIDAQKGSTIIGVPFGGKVPEDEHEVVLMHRPITPETPPFFMEDAVSARSFLRKYHKRAKLFITGDYHFGFYEQYKGTTLINPGPIMRSSKDKMEYVPKIYHYEDGKVEEIPVPIIKDVFDLEKLKDDKKQDFSESLKELTAMFQSDGKVYSDPVELSKDIMKELKTPKAVKNLVISIINGDRYEVRKGS